MYKMRPSVVLEKLRSGKIATCTKLNLADPRAAEIAALCGFDCVWPDMEHVPNDMRDIENIIRAVKAENVDCLCRVMRGPYNNLIRPLEADAAGIMVPHVMSEADAREVAHYAKFHPVGRRPIDGGNADGKYCLVGENDYIEQANHERFVCIQIEDPEPMEELDAICQVPGIDMIFFGPADFSQGVGVPYQYDDPKVVQASERVAKTARKYGKFAGTVAGVGNFDALVDRGYQFLTVGADVVALWLYWKDIVEKISGRMAI